MEEVQLYRMCLLKNEEDGTEVNKFLKIEHAQLGLRIHHTEKNWEIKGICSAIVKHDEMVAYVERYREEKNE